MKFETKHINRYWAVSLFVCGAILFVLGAFAHSSYGASFNNPLSASVSNGWSNDSAGQEFPGDEKSDDTGTLFGLSLHEGVEEHQPDTAPHSPVYVDLTHSRMFLPVENTVATDRSYLKRLTSHLEEHYRQFHRLSLIARHLKTLSRLSDIAINAP